MQLLFSSLRQSDNELRIATRTWGSGVKDICLVHGLLANSYWWSWVAKQGNWQARLMAPELSGMGNSQWRDSYSLLSHAHELASQIEQPMWLLGHSYGGMVSYVVSALYPEKVRGLILVDSPLKAWAPTLEVPPSFRSPSRPRIYSALDEMKQSFVLLPSQPFPSEAVKHELFLESFRRVGDEYHWLFDPALMKHMGAYTGLAELRQYCHVPICYLAGEHSELSADEDRDFLAYWAPQVNFITIKDAHHAVLLDQPEHLAEQAMAWIDQIC